MPATTQGKQSLINELNRLWQSWTLKEKLAFFDFYDIDEKFVYIKNYKTGEIKKHKHSDILFIVE